MAVQDEQEDMLPATIGGTPRARRRPAHLDPPPGLAPSPPVPAAAPIAPAQAAEHADGPTRFGDWELKGMAIDF